MKSLWKKGLLGVGIISTVLTVGCNKQPVTNEDDYLRCNTSSNLRMAETKEGYFIANSGLLYYADKENLSTWIPVCNKPDCEHGELNMECGAYVPAYNQIAQKDGKLYGVEQDGFVMVPYIYEIATDGSGKKNVKDVIEEDIRTSYFAKAMSQQQFIVASGSLTEEGMHQYQIIGMEEDSTYLLYEGTRDNSENVLVMSGNTYWGIHGDLTLITNAYVEEGESSFNELWIVKDQALQKLNLPDDIVLNDSVGAYLSGNLYTYYVPNEGFYQWNTETEEKTLLFEAQMEQGRGYIFNDTYMIECNRYFNYEPEETKLRFYNGDAWIDVEVPEQIQNTDRSFYPMAVASDRIFFSFDENAQTDDDIGIYYMMLEETHPEIVCAGVIGEKEEVIETSSEQDSSNDISNEDGFEDILVYDNENYLVKIINAYEKEDAYVIDLYYICKSSDENAWFSIDIDVAINGIQYEDAKSHLSIRKQDSSGHTKSITIKKEVDSYTDLLLSFQESGFAYDTRKNIHIYPQGEEQATMDVREPQETDVVLIDNESVSVVVTGYENTTVCNGKMNLWVTNKTNQAIQYVIRNITINDVTVKSMNVAMKTASVVKTILPNCSMSNTIEGMNEEGFTITGMKDIGKITFDIEISFGNQEPFVQDTLTVYPNGEEHAIHYERAEQATDEVIMDNEYVKVVVTGYEQMEMEKLGFGEMKDVAINYYIVNKTNETLLVETPTTTINGVSFSNGRLHDLTIGANQKVYVNSMWLPNELTEKHIAVIGERQILFNVYEYENEQKGATLVTEKITLCPNENTKWHVHQKQNTEKIVIDNEIATVIIVQCGGVIPDIKYYILNKTEQDLMFKLENITVNGKAMEDETECYVFGGTGSYVTERLMVENLETSNVTATFRAYEYDYKDGSVGDNLMKETIVINP